MIKLYTTPTCGQCKVIKIKLERKGIEFELCDNMAELMKLEIMSVPALKTEDGKLIRDFQAVNKYVDGLESSEK